MNDLKPLPRSFYEPSAKAVARALLGHRLLRQTANGCFGGEIVETEAYLIGDPACHGAPGLTARNRVMFGPAGHAYVYLIYGLHYCVNAVCRPSGQAEAVLIRAIEASYNQSLMQCHRSQRVIRNLTSGPAKLCEALDIDRRLDGADLCDPQSPVFIAENPVVKSFLNEKGPLVVTKRVGITKAADMALRFYLEGSDFVSKRVITRSRVAVR
jgi:DNA-3-methyladenine glycosylase